MKVIEKNATVWKVVTKRGRKKMSNLVDALPAAWVVEYRKGRWTYPTQKDSALFAHTRQPIFPIWADEELWRCTADLVDGELGHNGRALMTWAYNAARTLAAFWSSPAASAGTGYTNGTWCSRIRLEERA